jgi:hypothetical protein
MNLDFRVKLYCSTHILEGSTGEAMTVHPSPHTQTIGQAVIPAICVPVKLPIQLFPSINYDGLYVLKTNTHGNPILFS